MIPDRSRRAAFPACCLLLAAFALAEDVPSDPPREGDSPSKPASAAGESLSPPTPVDTDAEVPAGSEAAPEASLYEKTLWLDLSTASYRELVDWCRREGLSDSGQADDLRSRLAEKLKVTKGESAASASEPSSGQVTIESARKTEYFKAESVDERYARLSGDVKVRVKRGGKEHAIEADEITMNKTRNLLSARGNVVYSMKDASGEEWFFGDTLDVNMDTWEIDLVDARNERAPKAGDTKFIFSADSISRDENNVMVLENAVITSCDDAAPHFSIRSPRMWLLGGAEWAISNAVLFVGHVPVLWLPFFYLPSDEMFFNPVLGLRNREGRYLQTTTYLLGRKKAADSGFSLLKLARGNENAKKELKGFFLRTTNVTEDAATQDFVKVMADYYTNLGGFGGVQASLKFGEIVPKLDFFAGLGLSRNVYQVSSTLYSPFSEAHGFESVWNPVYVAGIEFPLRFGLNVSTNVKFAGVSLNLDVPVYSDPYFNYDFLDRSETLDWFALLQKGKLPSVTQSKLSSLQLRASLGYATPDLKDLAPWLESATLSKANTSYSFQTRTAYKADGSAFESVDPAREYFTPDQWVVADAGFDFKGTLFKYPYKAPDRPKPQVQTPGIQAEGAKPEPDASYRSPPDVDEKPKKAPEGTKPADEFRGTSPVGAYPAVSSSAREPLAASLSWGMTPSGAYEKRYNNQAWKRASDIDFTELYSLGSFRLSGDSAAKVNLYGNLLAFSAKAQGSMSWQEHSGILNDSAYVTDAIRLGYKIQDAQGTGERLTGNLSLSSNPFQDIKMLAATSFTYSMNALAYERKYSTMDGGAPVYKESWLDWTKDRITSHQAGLVIGIAPFGWNQTLSLSASLPPRDESYSGRLSLVIDKLTLGADTTMSKAKETDPFKFSPLSATAAWKPFDWLSVQDTFRYDIENDYPLDNTFSLTTGPLTANARHGRSKGYELVVGKGWTATGTEDFRFLDWSANLKGSIKPDPMFFDRFTLSVEPSSNLTFNMLKFTESRLMFNLAMTMKLNQVFDLTVSSSSTNSLVYKYFIGLPGLETGIPGDEWVNPVTDILYGFDFFNEANRYKSNFKVNSVSVALNLDLHDWTLTFGYTGKPELNTTGTVKKWDFNSYFTILLKWKAVSEIKTDLKIDPKGVTIQ